MSPSSESIDGQCYCGVVERLGSAHLNHSRRTPPPGARRAEAPCRWQGARAASAQAQAAADPGGAARATEGGDVRPGGALGDARSGAGVAARRPLGPSGGSMRHPPRRPPGDGPAAGGVARTCPDRPPPARSRYASTHRSVRADPPHVPPRLARRARGALDRRDVGRERRHAAEIHPARDRRRRRGLQMP